MGKEGNREQRRKTAGKLEYHRKVAGILPENHLKTGLTSRIWLLERLKEKDFIGGQVGRDTSPHTRLFHCEMIDIL